MTWDMPRTPAVTLLRTVDLDRLAGLIDVPLNEGCYWVGVVAAGSASAIMMPPIKEVGS
jgi:hypothetical protein